MTMITGERQDVQYKRRYQQPLLKCFGSVKVLTAGGTGTVLEGDVPPNGNCSGNFQQDPPRCSPSDRSIKKNIVCIGTYSQGIGLYLFDYKLAFRPRWGRDRQFGVMADEVERVLPEAVCTHPDGYKMVDYTMLGISRTAQ